MKVYRLIAGWLGIVFEMGCSEPPPKVVAPRAEPQEAPDVPTYCASNEKPCIPPPDFVEQLCADRFASVALYLFQKHTPFVRLHVKTRNVEPGNGFGGPTGNHPLVFGEELLLLRLSKLPASQPKRHSEEIYDALRWDGTCVTLPKRDAVTYLPAVPQAAPVEFNELDTTVRAALLRDRKLETLQTARSADCKQNIAAEDCAKSTKALSAHIVEAIRLGLRLPMPRQRPSGAGSRHVTASSATVP